MSLRILIALSFLLLTYSSSFAQNARPAKANYEVSSLHRRYATKVSSIHDVDFKNLKVFWHDQGVKLHDGSFRHKQKLGYDEVHLGLSEFLASSEGMVDHAVIDLEWRSCRIDCAVVGRVQVFRLQSEHPILVQEIEYDRSAPGTGMRFDRQNQILTITGRSDDRTLKCCPEHLDIMHFRWDGKSFVFQDAKTEAITSK